MIIIDNGYDIYFSLRTESNLIIILLNTKKSITLSDSKAFKDLDYKKYHSIVFSLNLND